MGFWASQSAAACRAFFARCGILFAVLLCALGFANEAHAQFAPPTVTNVNPNTGPPGGGTTVIITGTSFFGASAVSFGGNPAAFTFNSPTQLTAISPPGAGTVDVIVTAAGGTSAATPADRFTYAAVGSTTSLSSSPNPSSAGQPVTFTATVTGFSPTGTVTFFDGGTQIGTATLTGGTASFTTSSLSVGSHSITARYSGDTNNTPSTSAALIQNVNVPGDSIKLRQMQISATPVIAQISGQAIVGAINNAIDAGFNDNAQTVMPNGGGFTVQVPLDQPPPPNPVRSITGVPSFGSAPGGGGGGGGGSSSGPGSLANGRQGGNGAPPGTRLIDMAVMPLPPGSGMPPIGETQFLPDRVMFQFPPGTTAPDIAAMAQRLGLALVAQDNIGVLGRSIYTFRITNGQSVRAVIRAARAARVNAALQPVYLYERAQDQNNTDPDPDPDAGDATQYVIKKLHLAEAHRITKGDKIVIALIDSAIDFNQPNLAGAITERYDAGCGATAPDAHGTGMAGAIASHGELMGVAPAANIIAICAFGGANNQPQATSVKILKGLDHAIQRGARIVNMSFAGPHDPALSQALQIAREKGVLVIAAAGNKGPKSPPLYPGADPNVMAVTATDENDRLFNGANQGEYVSIAAPGVNVLVPAPDGGVQLTTGTSVATANVSGVAALLIAHKPSLTPEEIRAILVQTAKHLGSRGINRQFGAGLVDPLKALETVVSAMPGPRQASLDSFLASPDGNSKRVEQGFVALGYAGEDGLVVKAAPPAPPREWLAWIDVRGGDFNRNTFGSDLKGTQVNGLAGLTHKITPDFLVGVLGGYEHFDYNSQAFNGVLKGDGWTAGAYLGWRLFQNLRFNLGGAWSDVFVNDAAGLASGNFVGQRWLATGGLTGTFRWQALVLEPSAQAFALWEQENAYTDTLGTLQAARNFTTGRASGGVKAIYPFAWSSTVSLAPYVGVYGDYYFSHDDATTVGVTTVPLLQGWSARVTGGVAMTFAPGATLSAGGEYGGIGGDFQLWTWQARGSVAF